MAKKKTTKKSVSKKRTSNKKVVKKRTKKKTDRQRKKEPKKEPLDPKSLLYQKINLILAENPTLECELEGEDDEGRKYGYLEAARVFRTYNQAFKKHHLTIAPVNITPTLGNNCVLVNAVYQLTDSETGYSINIAGCGLGCNGQWAANSGQTLALKQALLATFLCSWPQPESFRDEVNRDAVKTFGPANSPVQIKEAMTEFFEQFPLGKK